MINRTEAPQVQLPDSINFDRATKQVLKNGIDAYIIEAGEHEVMGIDLIWKTGSIDCENKLLAETAFRMLTEGTATKTSAEISNIFDFYGAYAKSFSSTFFSGISLYCLSKYATELLSLIFDCIQNPIFPEKELATYVKNKSQKIILEEERVSYLSRAMFYEKMYGSNHVFGYVPKISDLNNLSSETLKSYYNLHIAENPFFVIITGKNTQTAVNVFNNSTFSFKVGSIKNAAFEVSKTNHFNETFDKKGAIQNAIRFGKQMIGPKHPDFHLMTIANTVLGGYFGSRLMKNIREDKGYTYGIFSSIRPISENESIWVIGTEVGSEVSVAACNEIKKEIDLLSTELVSDNELELVKNYLIGSFLSKVDGPFALADRFKEIHHLNLDYSFFDEYIKTVKNTTPAQLKPIFAKYFSSESFSSLIVGTN